jgi:lipopolysaccharide export system protein LptC
MSSRWLAAGLAMVVAAAAALWAWQDSPDASPVNHANSTSTEPDVFGQNVRFNQLRPDGSLHYSLMASAIRQFEAEELTRMTAPELKLINLDQPPWDIAAKHGYIRRQSSPIGTPEEVVFLREQVELLQNHPEMGMVTMRSAAFYIYPDRQFAETDQDVIIDTNVGRTKAGGLQANLENGLLKLSSSARQRVHTIVLPEQFQKN